VSFRSSNRSLFIEYLCEIDRSERVRSSTMLALIPKSEARKEIKYNVRRWWLIMIDTVKFFFQFFFGSLRAKFSFSSRVNFVNSDGIANSWICNKFAHRWIALLAKIEIWRLIRIVCFDWSYPPSKPVLIRVTAIFFFFLFLLNNFLSSYVCSLNMRRISIYSSK